MIAYCKFLSEIFWCSPDASEIWSRNFLIHNVCIRSRQSIRIFLTSFGILCKMYAASSRIFMTEFSYNIRSRKKCGCTQNFSPTKVLLKTRHMRLQLSASLRLLIFQNNHTSGHRRFHSRVFSERSNNNLIVTNIF